MSEPNTEPHVSGQDLRAALATNGRSRPNPLMAPEPAPAWEWTTDEQAELQELREAATALQAQVEDLRRSQQASRARETALEEAIARLAEARPWQRRGIIAQLTARGLV